MSKRTALDFIANESWAIRPEWLDTICTIALREHEYANDVSALEQKLGRPLSNSQRTSVRDGVAIVPISGPLFRHANMMTEISGATSYQMLATDIRAALDDPSVSGIVLNIDSAGGAVKGVNELAKQIQAVRGVKPIVAYVGGEACSAAYWLASACDEIVADEAATVGSIGAMISVRLMEAKAGEKTYQFVSSQSPNKNASPETEAGAREIQRFADELAQVFIETVARNRGIDENTVLDKYGQGAIFSGAVAKARGMVDKVGTLEEVISRLSKSSAARSGYTIGAKSMSNKEEALSAFLADHPDAAAQLRAEGATAERERIQAVRAQTLAGHEALIESLAFDGKTTGEQAAIAVLAAERSAQAARGNARSAEAPSVVAFASDGDAVKPEAKSGKSETVAAPVQGYAVNQNRAELDAKAKAYMAEHKCDYVTAYKAISQGD